MSALTENKRKITAVRGMGAALIAFAGWIVLYIVFGLIEPNIFTANNMRNLLRSMAKYLLVGVGQSVVLITSNIDLSIGSVVAMSAMISATLMTAGVNAFVAVLVAIICCLMIGLINGILVGKFKLPPFIATLGTMFGARGIAYMANGNRNTNAISSGIGKEAADKYQDFFYYGKTLGIYNAFWIALVIFLLVFFIMNKTRSGRHIYAIGSNVEAAKLSGVNVFATTTKAYLISAFCSCVVGLILAGQAGMGNMEAGNCYEMYGVAAGVIGGISPMGGTGLLLGAFAGSGVWQTLENGLGIIGAPVGIQRVVIGVIVAGAVLADVVFRQGASARKSSKKTEKKEQESVETKSE